MKEITIIQMSRDELMVFLESTISRVLSHSKPAQPTNQALNIKEAANYAGCADTTIRKAFRERQLKGHRQAGRLYFFEEDLIQWIKKG